MASCSHLPPLSKQDKTPLKQYIEGRDDFERAYLAITQSISLAIGGTASAPN